uniref:FBA_2 domain-containing protein n=1 Tax=Caenorhabditis tropicalis TaxID=1561998 RepID=A0A1I7TXA4_9PELO
MDHFPLFHLPAVAFAEVIRRLPLYDIREAPRLSVKMAKKMFVELVDKWGTECVEYHVSSSLITTNNSMEMGNSKVPISIELNEDSEYIINLSFQDKFEGLKLITEHLCSLFKTDISNVYVSSVLHPDGPANLMEWILERQKGFPDFIQKCGRRTDTADTAIEHISDKENRTIFSVLDKNQGSVTASKMEGKWLNLRQCFWLTLDNLLSVNCSVLNVTESQLKNVEMNRFLKKWMESDMKFKEMKVHMEVIDSDVLFSGTSVTKREVDVKRIYPRFDSSSCYEINGGFDIKRKDGMIATIIQDQGPDQERLFHMIVWEKKADKPLFN